MYNRQINAVVCGHLIVAWLVVVSLLAYFNHGASAGIFGVGCGIIALALIWIDESMKTPSQINRWLASVIAAAGWVSLLVWATAR